MKLPRDLAFASPLLLLLPLGSGSPGSETTPASAPQPATVEPATSRHCQVPCGIYGDRLRIDLLMEDAATIEKGMTSLHAFDREESPSKNQIVRWVMNKDEHAQRIQDQVASYWLAQRIKTPKEKDRAARDAYHAQLELLHRISVAAMKCKQTAELEHVAALRRLALDFSGTYFKKEDLEHIRSHHGPGGAEKR